MQEVELPLLTNWENFYRCGDVCAPVYWDPQCMGSRDLPCYRALTSPIGSESLTCSSMRNSNHVNKLYDVISLENMTAVCKIQRVSQNFLLRTICEVNGNRRISAGL